mmetsp:Transcript_67197/g.216794  ORF Transcript_67197/g.216794 Transcript_67197/m.216794 type:complete len:201 (+) Transcript_67197:636-1238(+)
MRRSTSRSISVASSFVGRDLFAQGTVVKTGSIIAWYSAVSQGGGSGFAFFAQPPKLTSSSELRFRSTSSRAKEILATAGLAAARLAAAARKRPGSFFCLKACRSSACAILKWPLVAALEVAASPQSLHLKRIPLVCKLFAAKRASRSSQSSQLHRGPWLPSSRVAEGVESSGATVGFDSASGAAFAAPPGPAAGRSSSLS